VPEKDFARDEGDARCDVKIDVLIGVRGGSQNLRRRDRYWILST
jgi:hypothetical protein